MSSAGSSPDPALAAQDALHIVTAILWLDTFPREIGREPGRADRAEALALAKTLIASGHDKNLTPLLRGFAFLPFMHSDDLKIGRASCRERVS
jgi:uncharacterized protein (DUF924 family)